MAEPKEILHQNWFKAGLGLLYVKEGIQDFIVDEINNFHSNVLQGLPDAGCCTIHTIQNVLKCPTLGMCSGRACRFHDKTDPGKTYTPCRNCEAIRTAIEKAHRYSQQSYKNTRSKLWCTVSWELAKCFMPAQGYLDKTADDTDLSGLISVILNNKDFQNKITENLGQQGNKFEKVRNARNVIMHNATMETSTTDLNSHFNILNDVLNDSKHLQGLTKVKDAKDKLHQLQSNRIIITTEDEQMIREESLKALDEKKEESIQEIGKSTEEGIEKINCKVTEGIAKFQAEVYKITEAEAVKRQQNDREHMHIAADKEYKRKTDESVSPSRRKDIEQSLENQPEDKEDINSNCPSSNPVNCNLNNPTSSCHGDNCSPMTTECPVRQEDSSSCPGNNNAMCKHSDCSNMAYDLFAMSCHTGILGGGHYVAFANNPNKKWYCYNDSSCKCHTGILGRGHYVAFAKNPNKKWYCYNDSSCKEVQEGQMDTNAAYILLYQRTDMDYKTFMPNVNGKWPDTQEVEDEFDSEFKKACVIQ